MLEQFGLMRLILNVFVGGADNTDDADLADRRVYGSLLRGRDASPCVDSIFISHDAAGAMSLLLHGFGNARLACSRGKTLRTGAASRLFVWTFQAGNQINIIRQTRAAALQGSSMLCEAAFIDAGGVVA